MHPATIDAIKTLRCDGLTRRAIADTLDVTEGTVQYWSITPKPEPVEVAEVKPDKLPLETQAGMIWHEPVKPTRTCSDWRKGQRCEYEWQCKWAVTRGHFVACERPLKRELASW